MMHPRFALAVLAFATLAGPAAGDDTGCFIMRLGRDTVSVERYTRTPAQVVVDQVGRAPRVLRRHYVYDYANGALTHFSMVVTPPGAAAPTQTVDATAGPDSLVLTTRSGDTPPRVTSIAFKPGGLMFPLASPWSGYEGQIMKLVRSKADSLHGTQYFLGASQTYEYGLRRLKGDSVEVRNENGDVFHVRVDGTGRVLGVLPIHGTGKFSVERVASLDLDAFAAASQAAEQAGAGLGVLSPRDTVQATVGAAALWIDYGRPGKRGRDIFGAVVPYGEIWRTGANAATQFKTDRGLDFGGIAVPAGFYTMWTLPGAKGWKLVINGETGQWGTEHHADRDLYTIDMKLSALPQSLERFTIGVEPSGAGGVLNLDWDTTRASASFTVAP